jgi:magnesium transporter
MTMTRAYRDGELVAEGFAADDISDYVADPKNTVWVDVCAPTMADLDMLSRELGLHSLAVEDAVHPHQRPKLDVYSEHLFLTAYAVELDEVTGQLAQREISAFITGNALVTVRKSEDFPIKELTARWDSTRNLAVGGVAFLLHGLLDYVVDTHFEAVQSLDDQIEALEDELFSERTRDALVQRRTYELRKSLVTLRRVVLPMREVVNTLLRRDLHIIPGDLQPYYQDVYDHVLRATEWTESLRDLVTTILETHLSLRGNRLNVVMKQVTSWAAIIAVPTAVTGFYGQNVPYPGFGHPLGFWVSSAVIVVLSGGLYLIFKRKEWI